MKNKVELQLATFKMSAVGILSVLAFDVDAARRDYAEKMSMLLPADFTIPFSQWPIVAGLIDL